MSYEFVDKPHHTSLLPVTAGSEIAIGFEHGLTEGNHIVCGDPGVERHSFSAAFGAEEASNQNIEAEASVLLRRNVSKVINVRMLVEIVRAHHADIPFPRPAAAAARKLT